jgi:hypothetical protein
MSQADQSGDLSESSNIQQRISTTTVLQSKCHSERPKGAKNPVSGEKSALTKRDSLRPSLRAGFVVSLLRMTCTVVVLGR